MIKLADEISKEINQTIKDSNANTNLISDGYHTFGELYEFRHLLFIALCRRARYDNTVYKTKKNFEGEEWKGWFLLCLTDLLGQQISFHLPNSYWEMCDFNEVESNYLYDGHTSKDVLERLKDFI